MHTSGIHRAKAASRGAGVELAGLDVTLSGPTGPVNILSGVGLSIAAGERVAVVGPSGSGKTTLMMVCAGLERPAAGTVTVGGEALAGLDEDALARFRRARTGVVFQQFHLIPTMTARENVAVPLELAGRRDAFTRADAALAAVGLGERTAHYPGQLSGGEQQRCALARAFAPEPGLLLADEPTGNLDGPTGRQVIDLMFQRSREHGTTLMLITHDHQIAARCDRVIHLRDGAVTGEETGAASADERVVPLSRERGGPS